MFPNVNCCIDLDARFVSKDYVIIKKLCLFAQTSCNTVCAFFMCLDEGTVEKSVCTFPNFPWCIDNDGFSFLVSLDDGTVGEMCTCPNVSSV